MEEKIEYRYFKIGEFSTVRDIRDLLAIFPDDMNLGFINQEKQDLWVAVQRHNDDIVEITHLGFQ